MPRRVPERAAIDHVRNLVAARNVSTVWIGIDGFGAAGKTTLAERMAAALGDAAVVHIDDFSGPREPEWDWGRFVAQVRDPLLAGHVARYQSWDWDRDEGGAWHDIAPGHPVIVEGVSSTRAEVGIAWDVQIWVDAPRDVRLTRALERDGPARLSRWLDDWMPSEERYAARERPQQRADLIVSGVVNDI
jgi:uridine kinase